MLCTRWLLIFFVVQDLGKDAGGDDGTNDGNLSGNDDEGIDAENNDMKHYSNGKAEFEINRPSATLKHPGRSGKPYMRKDVQGRGLPVF